MVLNFRKMPQNWKWNPRLDLDLGQRCLFIIALSWTFAFVTSPILPAFLVTLTDISTLVALIAAVAKSSIQHHPEGRSVLITGIGHNKRLHFESLAIVPQDAAIHLRLSLSWFNNGHLGQLFCPFHR